MSLHRKIAPLLPGSLKRFIRSRIDFTAYDEQIALASRPTHLPNEQDFGSRHRLGLLKEYSGYHYSLVQACIDLGISYEVLDIGADDWIERFNKSACSSFLVWPSSSKSILRTMFEYRVRYLVQAMGKIIYPSLEELEIYENKLKFQDWLKIHDLPHARTFISFQREEALDYVRRARYPLVTKTAIGATASGVKICRSRAEAEKQVLKMFGPGVVPDRYHPSDRQWGYLIVQEFIADAKEWRMVRLGDSFFGYRKVAVNDLHSGSHEWAWDDPPVLLLDFLREVTDRFSFRSMAMDTFEDAAGNLFINEMQTVFGARFPEDQLRVNGQPGRYIYDSGAWHFEAGSFCANACGNLRVEDALHMLELELR